jgi:ADP-ribose pyrophosphatase YjhB (NUDIX family)
MTRVLLACIAMSGSQYVLFERDGHPVFPQGELRPGEAVPDAMRRVVEEWTGTRAPKLELVDLLSSADALTLLYRAILTDEPKGAAKRVNRMELPDKVGLLGGRQVEEALKTSLAYKLTRA